MLIAPLLLFVFLTFIMPIASMLMRSVDNEMVGNTLPKTVVAIENWDASSGELPDETVYAAFADDLIIAVNNKEHTKLGTRLNYEKTGMSSLFRKTGRKVKKWDPVADAPFKDKFIEINKGWGDPEVWATIHAFIEIHQWVFPECH